MFRLSKGVDIINKIDGTKFLLITNRIVKAISKDLDEPFTTEERDKLQHSLELSSVEVDQLISTTTHILKKVGIYDKLHNIFSVGSKMQDMSGAMLFGDQNEN